MNIRNIINIYADKDIYILSKISGNQLLKDSKNMIFRYDKN